jgi:hypothetical protein
MNDASAEIKVTVSFPGSEDDWQKPYQRMCAPTDTVGFVRKKAMSYFELSEADGPFLIDHKDSHQEDDTQLDQLAGDHATVPMWLVRYGD